MFFPRLPCGPLFCPGYIWEHRTEGFSPRLLHQPDQRLHCTVHQWAEKHVCILSLLQAGINEKPCFAGKVWGESYIFTYISTYMPTVQIYSTYILQYILQYSDVQWFMIFYDILMGRCFSLSLINKLHEIFKTFSIKLAFCSWICTNVG